MPTPLRPLTLNENYAALNDLYAGENSVDFVKAAVCGIIDGRQSVINVEENLDENAERDFHEFGISYSTQALRNLIMKDCEKAAERRRENFEASMAVRQAQRAKQVVAILN